MTRPLAPTRAQRLVALRQSETEWLAQVVEVAELFGWKWAHFRPAKTAHGWRTPVSGPVGKGWPDLVLTRERDGRMVLAELKSADGKLDDDQSEVLDYLRRVSRVHGWLTVAVWRPADFEVVVEVLT